MDDLTQPKAVLESFAYGLDLEVRVSLLGVDFEIHAACAVASAIERVVQACAANLDPKLGTIKLGLAAEAEAGTLRLRPILNGNEFSTGLIASLVATALWSSVIGLKAGVESSVDSFAADAPEVAGVLKREFREIEGQLQAGQAVEVTCLIKESWEYRQNNRQRTRSEEWRVESGQIRRPGDDQPIPSGPQPLAGSSQIPLRWPFRPLSFFGPGDPFTPWWEKPKK